MSVFISIVNLTERLRELEVGLCSPCRRDRIQIMADMAKGGQGTPTV